MWKAAIPDRQLRREVGPMWGKMGLRWIKNGPTLCQSIWSGAHPIAYPHPANIWRGTMQASSWRLWSPADLVSVYYDPQWMNTYLIIFPFPIKITYENLPKYFTSPPLILPWKRDRTWGLSRLEPIGSRERLVGYLMIIGEESETLREMPSI